MTGLNTKTEGVQASLDLMNTKLDEIITLLGGVPPTPTATLDDLLEQLVLIKADTSDIHIDTMSMDAKLLAIRNYMLNPAEEPLTDDYTSIVYNVMWLRRAIAASTFAGSLDYRMQTELHAFNVNADTLISTTNNLINILQATLVHALTNLGVQSGSSPSYVYEGWLAQILNWLAKISASEGLPIDGGNRNIIELLARIADRPESQIGSGLLPPNICEEPYISTGMVLVPGIADPLWPSLIYAVFGDDPPAGIEYGSIFGIGTDYTELHNTSGNWSGWKIYVASSAANFGTYTGISTDDSLARYPTNVWYDLSFYDQNLAVFVPGTDSLRVYLCGAGWGGGSGSGGPWGEPEEPTPPPLDCFEVTSISTTYQNDSPFSVATQGIVWSSIPGLITGDSMTSGSSPPLVESLSDSDGALLSDMDGWTIEMLAGVPPIHVIWITPDDVRHTDNLDSIGETITLPATQGLMIVYPASNGSTTPFTVELCPPV